MSTTDAVVPIPKQQKTIDLSDLGVTPFFKKMSFSPDGRYLAIVYSPTWLKSDIVVWDLKLNKKQSLIHCPYNYGDMPGHDLLWSNDGKVISFGAKRQWDPMTGANLPDNPAIGRNGRLNKDGTKLLTIVGKIGDPSYIHIYDTKDWSLQKLYVDGLSVESAAWTAEDKIMVDVHATRETIGKTIDGYTITHGPDVALRLLDPAGKEPTKAVWFPAERDNEPGYAPWKQAISLELLATSFGANVLALGANRLVDGETLQITTYYTLEELPNRAGGGRGVVFSPDGRFLYIKDGKWFDNRRPVANAIIDVHTGKEVATFSGGDKGIAITPDGRTLAVGDQRAVQILSVQ